MSTRRVSRSPWMSLSSNVAWWDAFRETLKPRRRGVIVQSETHLDLPGDIDWANEPRPISLNSDRGAWDNMGGLDLDETNQIDIESNADGMHLDWDILNSISPFAISVDGDVDFDEGADDFLHSDDFTNQGRVDRYPQIQVWQYLPDGRACEIALAVAGSGARAEVVGRVGDDPAGDRLLIALALAGVGHAAVLRDPARPTPVLAEDPEPEPDPADAFAEPPEPPEPPEPADAFADVPGVRETSRDGTELALVAEGALDPLVKALARYEVVDLVSHEPDLEDVFLAYYGRGADDA